MKKILILANHDMGLYNFRIELIERLILEGYDVHFSVPIGEKVPLIEKTGSVYHPTRINRRGKNVVQDGLLLLFYLRLIRSLKPAIVLTYTAKPNIYGGFACQVTGAAQLANITGLGSELQEKGKAEGLLRRLYRTGLRRAKVVFFQNDANLAYFREHNLLNTHQMADKTQQHVVLPGSGVNLDKYKPCEGKQFETQGVARFLFVGRIMKDKGIEEFLTAAKQIRKEFPLARFDILGFYEADEYKEQIEALIAGGIINSAALSEDTRVQMGNADCVVLPSWHEGMSNVLLEAAASGLPVITVNIPGCREAVIDGVTGYLCKPRDADHLSRQMKRFILHDAYEKQQMGSAGRQLMLERFDRNVVIRAYLACIEDIILND